MAGKREVLLLEASGHVYLRIEDEVSLAAREISQVIAAERGMSAAGKKAVFRQVMRIKETVRVTETGG